MYRHQTPKQIAYTLARHAPLKFKRVLDPSTGNGLLLEPLLKRALKRRSEFVAIDNDAKPLKIVIEKFAGMGDRLTTICQDFLSWAAAFRKEGFSPFDCIVMNPPFSARKDHWVSYDSLKQFYPSDNFPNLGPIEGGFVVTAISLLKMSGRLLCVLPASVITTPTFGWLRAWMRKQGTIHKVHELPRFTFPGIGSRIYLVILEKSLTHNATTLLNHDLEKPERFLLETESLSERLDFGYHHAKQKLIHVVAKINLGWRSLDVVASIERGIHPTPGQPKSVIHSTDFADGFWKKSRPHVSRDLRSQQRVAAGDILVRRVSRNCTSTFGLTYNAVDRACSDCVLIIRPISKSSSIRLLFALRCFFTLASAKTIIERGTGASYIGQNELATVMIPYNMFSVYPKQFAEYRRAVLSRDFSSMLRIEQTVHLL